MNNGKGTLSILITQHWEQAWTRFKISLVSTSQWSGLVKRNIAVLCTEHSLAWALSYFAILAMLSISRLEFSSHTNTLPGRVKSGHIQSHCNHKNKGQMRIATLKLVVAIFCKTKK